MVTTRAAGRDIPVAVATMSLVAVSCWKVGLAMLAPEPLDAVRILRRGGVGEPAATEEIVVRPHGVVDEPMPSAPNAGGVRSPLPRRALRVEPGGADHAPLRYLLQSFGYARETVLVTVDPEGHVVRVRPYPDRSGQVRSPLIPMLR